MRMGKNEFIFETKSHQVYPIVHFSPQNGESKLLSDKLHPF